MDASHYSYRVTWSDNDGGFVATMEEFPSLSWLADDQCGALRGLVELVAGALVDMEANGEAVTGGNAEDGPQSRRCVVLEQDTFARLAMAAAKQGVSLDRLVAERLAQP